MTDEIYGNIQNLAFSAANMTSSALKQILSEFLRDSKQLKRELQNPGKVSLQKLKDSGYKITNIEINDGNIGDFKHIARKYDIDFALKRTVSLKGEVRDFVFFKAKDIDTMEKAFTEYTAYTMDRGKNEKRRSYKDRMHDAKEKQQERHAKGKDRTRSRGQDHTMPNI